MQSAVNIGLLSGRAQDRCSLCGRVQREQLACSPMTTMTGVRADSVVRCWSILLHCSDAVCDAALSASLLLSTPLRTTQEIHAREPA